MYIYTCIFIHVNICIYDCVYVICAFSNVCKHDTILSFGSTSNEKIDHDDEYKLHTHTHTNTRTHTHTHTHMLVIREFC